MRIGLIAMSGVRACDAELLRLGLTLPGFVERSQTIASLPSLGLLTLAGMTPGRHQVVYRDIEEISDLSLGDAFDLVAISTFTAQVPEAYRVAEVLRAAGAKVVMGGLHVTTLPEEALRYCDAVMVGEGEVCWPDILADAERGELKRVYRSRPREFDLREAPMPAFGLLDMERYNRITVQTSRGCPLRCEFCASSILLTDRYKVKPAEKVLAEIDAIAERWPRPFIEFADDNSFVDRAYWKRLLPALAERRVRWFTETDLRVAEDDELLGMMRAAGCAQVLIGLESPTAAGLRRLELRSDWKHKRLSTHKEAVRRVQSHGIRVNGCFVLGLDGHGPDVFDRVFDAAAEYELYDVQVTLQTPFPGTPLYRRLKAEGRLTHDGRWERCTLFDLNYEPRGMTAAELVDGFRRLVVRLYSDEQTRWRRETFAKKYARVRKRASDTKKAHVRRTWASGVDGLERVSV
ncbi:MAG: radical SAM protein [Planctomycetota bacterium]